MKEIELSFGKEFGRFDSFHDIFRFLISLDAPIMVVLDEYNELKDSYGGIQTDSMMQKIIDSLAETNVRVILSGSAISVMAELLDSCSKSAFTHSKTRQNRLFCSFPEERPQKPKSASRIPCHPCVWPTGCQLSPP